MHSLSKESQIEILRFVEREFNRFILVTTAEKDPKLINGEVKVMLQFIRDLIVHYKFGRSMKVKLLDISEFILVYAESLLQKPSLSMAA